ncbi:MAG TPA: UbiA-like polyprenyltransferase [Gemmatimonadales bacterium]|nr:UbiA-like polyprenyltransferase [Gemmatimonadales bacterium]
MTSEVGEGRGRSGEVGGGHAREGQILGGESLLVRYANFVKLPHTIFALPFALLGVVVASREAAVTWRTLALVVVAFTAARFVALGFNRIADRELDARNPRTRGRELPTGRLTLTQAWVAVAAAAALFLWSAWALNPLCFALSPIALVFISAYSYTKRFTSWSHVWLGLADGIATPAGYLAVTGRWSDPWWLLPVGALAVTFWVGGFDVFYALPDEAFDRAEGLESLVVRLGQARAILVAKLLHGLALVALVGFGLGAGLGVAYYVGVGVGAALIIWEHQLVRPGDLRRLNAAFFTANGIVSVVVFLGALVDRIL